MHLKLLQKLQQYNNGISKMDKSFKKFTKNNSKTVANENDI